jgi:hypothetical protein
MIGKISETRADDWHIQSSSSRSGENVSSFDACSFRSGSEATLLLVAQKRAVKKEAYNLGVKVISISQGNKWNCFLKNDYSVVNQESVLHFERAARF